MRAKTRWFPVAVSFAAIGAALSAPRPAEQPAPVPPALEWEKINQEAIEKLSEYIRIDTSNPPGNETRGVEWLAKIFRAAGIPYETAESAPGRGSIAARLKGTGSEPALILLSHIDVVPVNREFWTVDPFAGVIRDGYIWGRGTVDMKGTATAELMAFLLLHRTKTPLRRDVIFLATADEEAGGEFGAGWVVKNRPRWFAGAGFLLNEGARSRRDDSGKPVEFGVGPTEKTPAWLKLTATGEPGHGSVPRPNSAVNHLVAALERLRVYEPLLEVTPPMERAMASQAPYEQGPWRTRLRDIREYVKNPEARAELAKVPSLLALLTNTISITGLEGTKKINVIPPVATAWLDCRLLPGWTAERWVREVRGIIQDDSIRVDVVLNFPPTESPIPSALHNAIAQAVERLHPGAGVTQSVSTGFTDSHFFRERGITSYGFGAIALPDAVSIRAHGNDERIPVKAFTDGVRMMWEVVYNFCKGNA